MGVADQKIQIWMHVTTRWTLTDAYFLRRYSPFGCRDAADAGLRRRAADPTKRLEPVYKSTRRTRQRHSAASISDKPSLVDVSASQVSRNTSLSVLQPRQPGWSQWHASAVTFFESWQTWLQYFCLSGAIQLQAGCAHFFASAITSPPHCPESCRFQKKTRLGWCCDAEGWGLGFPESRDFPRITHRIRRSY